MSGQPGKTTSIGMIVLTAVIIGLVAATGYIYTASSSEVSSLQTVNSQLQMKSSQYEDSISTLNSNISVLQTEKNLLNSQIATLSSNITSLQDQKQLLSQEAADLNGSLMQADANLTQVDGRLTQAQANITSLNARIAPLQSQINSLTSQTSNLTSKVLSLQQLNDLGLSQVEAASEQFSTGSSASVVVATFTANNAGYVAVTASAASDEPNEGIQVNNVFSSSIQSPSYSSIVIPMNGYFDVFSSSTPSTLVFPVVPGTVTLYLQTSDTSAQSATLSVTYYY